MDMLIDSLDFCKDFLTALIPSVCGILVQRDCMSSETKYEVMLTFNFLMKSVVSLTYNLRLVTTGNDQVDNVR